MTHQELLWKYAEGQCSPAEANDVERLLAKDVTLQKDLDSILEVHAALQGMEVAVTSNNFSQNVMDALPDLYAAEIVEEPLVKPIVQKIFWMLLAVSFALVFNLSKGASSTDGRALRYFEEFNATLVSVISQVPEMVLLYFVLTLFAMLLLIAMDRLVFNRAKNLFLF